MPEVYCLDENHPRRLLIVYLARGRGGRNVVEEVIHFAAGSCAPSICSPTGLKRVLASSGESVPIIVHENTEDAAILGGAMTFDDGFWAVARTRLPAK
jgi:hypothetical protein